MSSTEAHTKFPLVFSRLDGSTSTTPIVVDFRHPNVGEYVSTQMFSIHRSAFITAMDDKGNIIKENVLSVVDGSAAKSKLASNEVDFLANSLASTYKHVRFNYLICSTFFFNSDFNRAAIQLI